MAVASDGRSYSRDLLPAASQVLLKTGKIGDNLNQKVDKLGKATRRAFLLQILMHCVASKIERLGKEEEEAEIKIEDVPDEFLDPIMSTLMTGTSQFLRSLAIDAF